jgi:hypothetical protein
VFTLTMQLVGPYMTTTNYKKRKAKKTTDNQLIKLEQEWRAYNKNMRKINCHSAQFDTFEQYLSYVQGEHKPKKQKQEFTNYKPNEPMRRQTPHYPSCGDGVGNGFKKEAHVYSGERQLLGVATMHKSNMVPIFADKKEDAKDIASMRR